MRASPAALSPAFGTRFFNGCSALRRALANTSGGSRKRRYTFSHRVAHLVAIYLIRIFDDDTDLNAPLISRLTELP